MGSRASGLPEGTFGAKKAPPTSSGFLGSASVACSDTAVYVLSKDRSAIQHYNHNLALQKTYSLNRLLFTRADLDSIHLAPVGANLYVVITRPKGIILRRVTLVK